MNLISGPQGHSQKASSGAGFPSAAKAGVNALLQSWRSLCIGAIHANAASSLERLLPGTPEGVDLKAEVSKMLLDACAIADAHVVKILLRHGANPEAVYRNRSMRVLHIAAGSGKALVCQALMESGADLHCRDQDGHTPLMLACAGGHVQAAEALLEAGADLDDCDLAGKSPIQMAEATGGIWIQMALIAYGASTRQIDSAALKTLKPAYAAARVGMTQQLIRLLEQGAPAHEQRYKLSVVEEAAQAGHEETAAAAQSWLVRQRLNEMMSRAAAMPKDRPDAAETATTPRDRSPDPGDQEQPPLF